ncbi:hypothetical protein HDU89_006150 [Geranomyces variabilis]|nr:hypothetical protein HDU89_006150 [Geranomyces variabilis]
MAGVLEGDYMTSALDQISKFQTRVSKNCVAIRDFITTEWGLRTSQELSGAARFVYNDCTMVATEVPNVETAYRDGKRAEFTQALDSSMEDPESVQYQFMTNLSHSHENFAAFCKGLGKARLVYNYLDNFLMNKKSNNNAGPREPLRARAIAGTGIQDSSKAWWAIEMLITVNNRPWSFWKTFILAGNLYTLNGNSKNKKLIHALDSKQAESMWINIERSLAIWQIAAAKGGKRDTLRNFCSARFFPVLKKIVVDADPDWVPVIAKDATTFADAVTFCQKLEGELYLKSRSSAVQHLLLRCNLEACGKPEPGTLSYISLHYGRITLEHIVPQRCKKSPDATAAQVKDADVLKSKVHMLGNLTLLSDRHNSSLSNNDWGTKKQGYLRTATGTDQPFALTRRLHEMGDWTNASFEKNHKELLTIIKDAYALDFKEFLKEAQGSQTVDPEDTDEDTAETDEVGQNDGGVSNQKDLEAKLEKLSQDPTPLKTKPEGVTCARRYQCGEFFILGEKCQEDPGPGQKFLNLDGEGLDRDQREHDEATIASISNALNHLPKLKDKKTGSVVRWNAAIANALGTMLVSHLSKNTRKKFEELGYREQTKDFDPLQIRELEKFKAQVTSIANDLKDQSKWKRRHSPDPESLSKRLKGVGDENQKDLPIWGQLTLGNEPRDVVPPHKIVNGELDELLCNADTGDNCLFCDQHSRCLGDDGYRCPALGTINAVDATLRDEASEDEKKEELVGKCRNRRITVDESDDADELIRKILDWEVTHRAPSTLTLTLIQGPNNRETSASQSNLDVNNLGDRPNSVTGEASSVQGTTLSDICSLCSQLMGSQMDSEKSSLLGSMLLQYEDMELYRRLGDFGWNGSSFTRPITDMQGILDVLQTFRRGDIETD